ILADVHARGVESQSEHLRDVIKSMWSWLCLDQHSDLSGVHENVMVGLRAPDRTKLDEVRHGEYVPPMHEIGRIMAITRSGAIDERIALAIQLLVYTCQRVTPVSKARRDGMAFAQDRKQGTWSMSAAHRKTADKRGDRSDHIVPLPPQAWAVVERAKEITEEM